MVKRCSLKLIKLAAEEKWIKQFAFWYLLKSQYKNSCYYSYKSRMKEISKRSNISLQTLYNYIKILREKGLLNDHGMNLTLKSIHNIRKELRVKRNCKINLSAKDNIFDVECKLYAKLIEQHVKKLAFMESLRRFGSRELYKMGTIENEFRPSLSIRNIAKLLNINKNRVVVVLKRLNELEIIKTENQKPIKISNVSAGFNPEHFTDMIGYRFVCNKKLYIQFGAKIQCLQYPVYLKRITSKVYVKYYKLKNSKKKDNL